MKENSKGLNLKQEF